MLDLWYTRLRPVVLWGDGALVFIENLQWGGALRVQGNPVIRCLVEADEYKTGKWHRVPEGE